MEEGTAASVAPGPLTNLRWRISSLPSQARHWLATVLVRCVAHLVDGSNLMAHARRELRRQLAQPKDSPDRWMAEDLLQLMARTKCERFKTKEIDMLQVLEDLRTHAESMYANWRADLGHCEAEWSALLTKIEEAIGIHRNNLLTVAGATGSVGEPEESGMVTAAGADTSEAAPSSSEPSASGPSAAP